MADEDVKIVIKQKGTIPVYTKTKVGVAEVHHDETLKGSGTINAPLGISDEVMEEIENAGKVDDVRVDGVSVVTNKIAEIDLTGKVDKTSEADKVYGTDAQGNQTTYDVDGFGKVDDVKVNGVSVVENKIANVIVPTKTSDITNDSGFITKDVNDLTNYTKTEDLADVALSGDYDDLINAPTNVSEFTNDANYQNATQVQDAIDIATQGVIKAGDDVSLLTNDAEYQNAQEVQDAIDVATANMVEEGDNVSVLNNDANYQNATQVSNTVSGAITTHNTSNNAHSNLLTPITQDIDAIEEKIPAEASSSNQLADKDYVDSQIGDLNEWTTAQYTPTTTNFVVGNTYTVEEAFQRTASLFAGQQGEIDDIEAVIPAQATAQNQLADKNFVNATVATNSANFRGNWSTWADVPTQANLYPEDYVGNRTPTNNDYMVVADASDYVPVGDLMHRLVVENLHSTEAFTIRITDENGVSKKYYYQPYSSGFVAIDDYYSLRYAPGRPGYWYIKTNDGRPIIIKGTTYSSGQAQLCTTNDPATPFYVGMSPQAGEYQGCWRFIYVGTWATDGKNGWHSVYQIGTAFTQEQQAAIDSGITKNMVDNYVDPNSTAATAYNARITAVETDKRDIINSANKVYATDNLGANKNDLVYDKNATAETIAQRGTNGVLKVGTPTDNSDATTKLYVDTIASAKQDTLTAGSGISIDANNVISSTLQESNYRGRWATWADVPITENAYPEDWKYNHTPTYNDYMVVEDASGYVPADILTVELIVLDMTNSDCIYKIGTQTYYARRQSGQDAPFGPNNEMSWNTLGTGSRGTRITFNDQVKYQDHVYNRGESIFLPNENGSYRVADLPKSFFIKRNVDSFEGSWRFKYNGVWETDGKSGWVDEYQIESTLPIADDQTSGIAKLYTTTGQNTDGSMTQKSITDALNAKANTSALTAHTSDTNNPHSVTKAQVGLGNVDNTSDLNKPISTATQTALNSKQDVISDLATIRSGASLGATSLQPGDNVSELTNDAGYTTNVGTVTSVNNTQPDENGNVNITTTGATWGSITGTLADQTDLQEALDKRILQDESLSLFPVGEEDAHVGEIRQYIGADYPLNKKFHGYFYQWTKTQLGPGRYSYGWEQWNVQPQGGGAVSDLTDVTLTDLSNGQVLVYNSSTNKWVNDDQHGGVTATYDATTKTITFA